MNVMWKLCSVCFVAMAIGLVGCGDGSSAQPKGTPAPPTAEEQAAEEAHQREVEAAEKAQSKKKQKFEESYIVKAI